MLHLKYNPVDVDVVVNQLQQSLWDAIPDFRPIWENYHRVYVNPVNQQSFIPELYVDGDYKEMLITDKSVLTTFITVSNIREVSRMVFSATMSLYIQCSDLQELFPTITHRPDEELENTFNRAYIGMFKGDIELKRTVRGVDDVYSGFDKKNVNFNDLNEFCLLRMDFDIKYTVNGCALPPQPIIIPCASGTAVNSDGSYSLSVPSGGTATIPDTTINFNLDFESESVTFPTLSDQVINITLV